MLISNPHLLHSVLRGCMQSNRERTKQRLPTTIRSDGTIPEKTTRQAKAQSASEHTAGHSAQGELPMEF